MVLSRSCFTPPCASHPLCITSHSSITLINHTLINHTHQSLPPQAEAATRAKEREADKAGRAADAARAAQAALDVQRAQAEEVARGAGEEAAGLRVRLAQAEGALKAKERELERALQVDGGRVTEQG